MSMTDDRRRVFMDLLVANRGIPVNEWEAEFLKGNMGRDRFSDKQRACIDRMIEKYGRKLAA